MSRILITGSSGLIGSEVCEYFAERGWEIHGVDNNARASFFGTEGDTRWNLRRLSERFPRFRHHDVDIRDRQRVNRLLNELQPDAIVHAAAQPSHDLAARMPFDDFDTNAVGTLNLLEGTRRNCPDAIFVHMSTNKVYGDAPNRMPLDEKPTRWDYGDPHDFQGVTEDMSIDQSVHSLFGASKVAADVMVQEYGRYFGLRCCCLRAGCLTGPNHSGVHLHGFLSYLTKCSVLGKTYKIIGHRGKQVRDNLHAHDVARFVDAFIAQPRCGEVYNLGGGRENSCSILEAIAIIEHLCGDRVHTEYLEVGRIGDHVCYISNLAKTKAHYANWRVTKPLKAIIEELYQSWVHRVK
jgi:CDP-paratose 2-epimerase